MNKMIIGNWKMNPATVGEAERLFKEIVLGIGGKKSTKVVICAPSPFIGGLFLLAKGKIKMGAEDCSVGDIGPHTGAVSAPMLRSIGAKYVILGHSERRAEGEDDELISKKIKSALSAGLKVVFCVGERERDETGEYFGFIKNQLMVGLSKTKKEWLKNLLIVYEPIWAIGKDAMRRALPADVLEVSIFIKKVLTEIFGREDGIMVPIIYGGSVDSQNSAEFLKDGGVEGLLVGRESLNAESFLKILKIANDA